jgi:hypothetical protein
MGCSMPMCLTLQLFICVWKSDVHTALSYFLEPEVHIVRSYLLEPEFYIALSYHLEPETFT